MSPWVEGVLAREPRVAVFDCDGTLWAPDSGAGFMRWSLEGGWVPRRSAERLRERYKLYEAGKVSEPAICGEMVQVYAGLPERELRAAARSYVEQFVLPFVFPELDQLVERLRSAGAELWAVSSTCDWVVEAGVVERFGIPPSRILAAKVHIADGFATDELLAVPTDAAKQAVLEGTGVHSPDAVFGNSLHDLAMLKMAWHPYAVNPSPGLREKAEALGWEIYEPKSGKARQS